MSRYLIILLASLGLTACASTQAPLDDAYYWEEKSQITNHKSQIDGSPIEYLNVQDTTVTIRVKK